MFELISGPRGSGRTSEIVKRFLADDGPAYLVVINTVMRSHALDAIDKHFWDLGQPLSRAQYNEYKQRIITVGDGRDVQFRGRMGGNLYVDDIDLMTFPVLPPVFPVVAATVEGGHKLRCRLIHT